jgi:hypothetical protein
MMGFIMCTFMIYYLHILNMRVEHFQYIGRTPDDGAGANELAENVHSTMSYPLCLCL